MNYIFCLDNLNDVQKSNNNITKILADEIAKLGNKSFIIGFDDNVDKIEEHNVDNYTLIKCPNNKIKLEIKKEKENTNRIKYLLNHPLRDFYYFFLKIKDESTYLKTIRRINNLKETKIVLPFFPFYTAFLLSRRFKNYIVYQMDPWGLHEIINKERKIKFIKQELYMFKKASYVYTTPELYLQYKNDKYYKKYIAKTKPIDLPLLKHYKGETDVFNDDFINIVYAGSLDKLYRDPSYVFEFFDNLIKEENMNIKLFLYGYINKNCTKIINKYHFIEIKGNIEVNEVERIINSNVILLNINNSLSNQTPSKIYGYLSSGNPIINVCKYKHNCEILEKYNNVYNIYENESNNVKGFTLFIKNCKKVSFAEIEKAYMGCIPKNVAKKLLGLCNYE